MTFVSKANEVSAQEIVGKGYEAFWNSKKRYVVCKGSRGSKKSTTAALKIITKMMEYPLANTLVVRQVATTLEDSCFAQLKWAIDRLGVSQWWEATTHPLKIRYKPTGQKIIFRGLDNPLKTTSVTVDHGFLCWAWMEEAFEVDEDSFDTIDESLRGIMPDGYYVQWLITFNPWDANSWLKRRFFDAPDDDTLALTTTYKCNEWLSDADRRVIEKAKINDPNRYKVIGLGEWGLAEGQFFSQWRSDKHVIEPFAIPRGWRRYRAMDWGTAHPYACYWIACDYDDNAYVYRELYGWGGKPNVGTGETAKQVAEKIAQIEPADEQIYNAVLDNACWAKPGTTGPGIAEEINRTLYEHRRTAFNPSSKGRAEGANQIRQRLIGNTLADGTQKPALYVFANCIHLIRTLPMLAYDKRNPEAYDTDGEDHACLIAGTMVTTDRGKKAIEDINPGDIVKTSKGLHKVINAGLTGLDAEVFTVTFSDGTTITGTANHPVYVIDLGFTRIKDLYIGDEVEVEQLNTIRERLARKSVTVCSVRKESRRANVYNLAVDGAHEFYANGIRVHNCDAIAYYCMARPFAPTRPDKRKLLRPDGYTEQRETSAWTT